MRIICDKSLDFKKETELGAVMCAASTEFKKQSLATIRCGCSRRVRLQHLRPLFSACFQRLAKAGVITDDGSWRSIPWLKIAPAGFSWRASK
jgi:hypothetical protein